MSESTEDIDKITAPPAPVQKIWPSRSNVVKCVILVLVGLGLGISSALVADWVPAGISLVLFLYGSCSIGWVEIEGDRITHRRLVRGGSARLIEIREIGLGVQRVKTSKWWFPVIDTHDGRSIDLASLKSLSRKRAEARVQRIHSMLESASAVRSDGPTFAKILGGQDEAVETVESEDDPTDDFDLTPGYTAYLREKALEEAAAASAAPPTLTNHNQHPRCSNHNQHPRSLNHNQHPRCSNHSQRRRLPCLRLRPRPHPHRSRSNKPSSRPSSPNSRRNNRLTHSNKPSSPNSKRNNRLTHSNKPSSPNNKPTHSNKPSSPNNKHNNRPMSGNKLSSPNSKHNSRPTPTNRPRSTPRLR